MSYTHNIQLNLRERLVVKKLVDSQETSLMHIASNRSEMDDIRAIITDEEYDVTDMDIVEDIWEKLLIYSTIRKNPNQLFTFKEIVISKAVDLALVKILEKNPHLEPEIDSIRYKRDLVRDANDEINLN